MRYIVVGVSLFLASSAMTSTAHQNYTEHKDLWDRPAFEYVAPAISKVKQTRPHMAAAYKKVNKKSVITPNKDDVVRLIEERATQKLGSRWAKTAVRLAYVESGFDPNNVGPPTAHGRARGVLQVMPQTARDMGYDPHRLSELDYGLDAGLEHMSRCIDSGVKTEVQMSRCHVSGVDGWKVRLNAGAERYRDDYVRLVASVDL